MNMGELLILDFLIKQSFYSGLPDTEGDIGVCGIAVLVNFSCGISVILKCVIAVFSESAG